MTLVVGVADQGVVHIASDTQLSAEMTKDRIPITEGIIKTKVISPTLTISFAGNSYLAQCAIGKINDLLSIEECVRILLSAHNDAEPENSPEFLIGSTNPEVSIIIIKNGTCSRVQSGWICSYQAFHAYRAFETGQRKPDIDYTTPKEIGCGRALSFSRMRSIIQQLIHDPAVTDIGGFGIAVVSHEAGFRYMGYSEVYPAPMQLTSGQNVLTFGTAEQGGYAYDVCGTADQQGVTSYFPQGRFGLLYWPEHGGFPFPRLIKDVDPFEFMDRAEEIAGARISTFFADVGILIQRANRHWALGNIDEALKDVTRATELSPRDASIWKKLAAANQELGRTHDAYGAAVKSLSLAYDDSLQKFVSDYDLKLE